MSAIIPWWRERLKARCPLSPAFMIDQFNGYNYKLRAGEVQDTWPARVARQALYFDYQSWHDKHAQVAFNTPYYKEFPERVPQYASELTFFSTLTPYLYVRDKASMVKVYWAKERKLFEGRWITVEVRRYFIRLGEYEEHRRAFVQETATEV